ncbi:hypothetical protein FBEOM_5165 [Fusarium beomiforme]|uniref:Uncharacterized protein n=1 Tax=Fusarium beomiforme TaxID=44412 RepID=A0A9P5E082_9HYPO|nr:hypothetical protein FBEOM_5165 [Fusarium beomiforme]
MAAAMSSKDIYINLEKWDFAAALSGSRRCQSLVSPSDPCFSTPPNESSTTRELPSQSMEIGDMADDYFPRFDSSNCNGFPIVDTKDAILGEPSRPCPESSVASDLEIRSFYNEDPDTIYLQVKFSSMQPIILK